MHVNLSRVRYECSGTDRAYVIITIKNSVRKQRIAHVSFGGDYPSEVCMPNECMNIYSFQTKIENSWGETNLRKFHSDCFENGRRRVLACRYLFKRPFATGKLFHRYAARLRLYRKVNNYRYVKFDGEPCAFRF